jgi:pilus assembly protein CpaB
MGRRTVLIIAAFVVAALGTTLIFLYVNNLDDKAIAKQQPVEVLVAKIDIPAGTSTADVSRKGMLELKKITKDSAAPTALSTLDTLTGKVALSTIYAGEQILPAKFGTTAEISSLTIPDNDIAVSVQLADPARVAGFVQPGSHVAVFLTLAQGGGTSTIRLLLPNALVVAVGPTTIAPAGATSSTGATNTEALPRAIMTLALSQREAEKIVLATQTGTVYFGLRSDKSKVAPSGGVSTAQLFS